jgi:metallo-beta-lactamase class B
MFASLPALAAAQVLPIVIPFGKPPQIEKPIAPIEITGPRFAAQCKDWDDYEKPGPAVRIFGNTYLVGTCGITSLLITDKAGDILIDGGTEKDADIIADNIRSLGFRLTDVKYLLHGHEHYDHIGGIDDGEQVRLGNTVLTAIATPGHTPGALSWRWGSCDGGKCRQIIYADSLTPKTNDKYRFSDHPAYLAAYRASIAKVAALDCDILLTPHPSASHMVDRIAGRAPLEDRNACRVYAADLTKQLDDRIAKEAAAK